MYPETQEFTQLSETALVLSQEEESDLGLALTPELQVREYDEDQLFVKVGESVEVKCAECLRSGASTQIFRGLLRRSNVMCHSRSVHKVKEGRIPEGRHNFSDEQMRYDFFAGEVSQKVQHGSSALGPASREAGVSTVRRCLQDPHFGPIDASLHRR